MKFFVDSREPQSVKNKLLLTDHDVEVKELDQADFYMPEKDVAVERKEASDFASSTTDGRLSEQADRMVAEHDHVFVIIENTIRGTGKDHLVPNSLYNLKHSNINDNSITGMQTSLAVKRGIKIIYTESIDHTVYAVNRVFERFMDEEHTSEESGYVKTADTGEVDDVQVSMLMQVQGISREKAEKIVEEIGFSSICSMRHNAFAPEEKCKAKFEEIDGIGSTLADRVINAFR
jgi:ERCC4-type nuclease